MQCGRYSAKPACIAAALRKASRRITQFYDTALAPAGLTVMQYSLLTELVRRGKRVPTVTELAGAMVMDRSGLGHTLGPLERDGLITLAVHSEDARARNVVLFFKIRICFRGSPFAATSRLAWLRAVCCAKNEPKWTNSCGWSDSKRLLMRIRIIYPVAWPSVLRLHAHSSIIPKFSCSMNRSARSTLSPACGCRMKCCVCGRIVAPRCCSSPMTLMKQST